ncbi:DegT/DnrJ/EryC1/StrS family aminotransferase [Candidatus Woesearchaeota archaeon]|nr:DegT/DnrJ/EryC1/StrS family aminotransferase [Candidatus Woesearchaeota archaeon]
MPKSKYKLREKFLVFGQPDIRGEEINEVIATLKSKWIGAGPRVKIFEEEFAKYVNAKKAIAVNSCTAALDLCLIASGIKPGDEIITTPMTFSATANVICHIGAKPVFVDVDYDTMNISPKNIEKAITKKTKAIIPVHMAGYPCDMDKIMEIAKKHNLIIIEDAAHAVGSIYKGKKIGSLGPLACFSFYPNKNITTIEGGIVTTQDEELAERIRMLSNHGLSHDSWKRFSDKLVEGYDTIEPGFNYRMSDVQAAIGMHHLRRYEKENLKRREEIAKRYDGAFKDLPLETPKMPTGNSRSSRYLYILRLDLNKLNLDRSKFRQEMFSRNIGTGIHYTALHLHTLYKEKYGYKEGDFPVAEDISKRTVSIPLSSALTEDDVNDVINAVIDVCNKFRK